MATFLVVMSPFGCQSTIPTTNQILLSPMLDTLPITAAQLYPMTPHSGVIGRRIGDHARQVLSYHLAHHEMDQWEWSLEGVRQIKLLQDPNGAIRIATETESAESVRVEYDPPLVMLPERLEMAHPIEQKSRMTVKNMSNGEVRDQGWCTIQIQLLGRSTVTTPSGIYRAVVVQTQRHIELQMALVQVTSITAYVPGVGQVSQQIHRVTRPLRLFEIEQTEELDSIR